MNVKQRRTRYFIFSRVNPRHDDYEHLVDTCEKIEACLAYKTVRDGWRVVLTGFFILRGPSTIQDDIRRLFPNFLLTNLSLQYQESLEWLVGAKLEGLPFFQDGEIFSNGKEHPFQSVKKNLFFKK